MPQYFYDLTDVKIQLHTPFPLQIGAESLPFLTEGTAACQIHIVFTATDCLPDLPENGCWIEDRYYATLEGMKSVFVRNSCDSAPHAVLTETPTGFACQYLKEFERFFLDSGDLLNLLGLENILLSQGGILLHASLIQWQGRGIVFSAPCGTGKSTQAALWEKYLGSEVFNGDRAGLRCVDGRWIAYGMPFAGTSGIYRKESVPVSAIVVLAQGPENRIQRLQPMDAVRKLLPECSCRRWDRDFMDRILSILLLLVAQIPVYHLECRPDQDAVLLLRDTVIEDERK